MADKRMIVEIGMGTDLTGADYTKAAIRALRDALPLLTRAEQVSAVIVDHPAAARDGEEALEQLVRLTPLGRQGTPADVAGAVLFFCSELAAFVTGAWLPVNGGHSILP